MMKRFSTELSGRVLTIEAGKVAKQAGGAVTVSYGDTVVLVTAVGSDLAREGIDFLPLTVDYHEMLYAAGRIPGSFFRREIGRPSEKETLTSRLIDRPLRPLFPKGYRYETQIIATVLSVDQENEPDILALIGASAALEMSGIPFAGPIAGVRVGRINGQLVLNPTSAQLADSDINIVVAGSKDAIVMVEGGGQIVPEEVMMEAIFFAHEGLQPILQLQAELREAVGKPKRVVPEVVEDEALKARVMEIAGDDLLQAITIGAKMERGERLRAIEQRVVSALLPDHEGREGEIKKLFYALEKETVRAMIVKEKRRIDGRGFKDIRPISCEVGVLPRTHGSALFTRGETQIMAVTTLGTSEDEQRIESLNGTTFRRFMLHYNFPPFCVGEVRMMRGPGRRDIGHGALAERAITVVLPTQEEFPYTIRLVSDVLESNGSSSMATICGGSLSLMDAGVPIKTMVAGIAMGLIKEGEEIIVLTDILGDEDHLGDMDFKVAGTDQGITALQMDIKIKGLTREIMKTALEQAREARLFILGKMCEVIRQPREALSIYAPKIVTIHINQDKIRDIIGPGGKVIRQITGETGAKIEVEDDGSVRIISPNDEVLERALAWIKDIVREPEVGELYLGKVKKIMDFGAFVEILPGLDGLVHISQLDTQRVNKVTDILHEGDEVMVKVIEIDNQGKVKLSRKAALGQTAKPVV
ncbi:MAG: polyribonucleotide nucleotidyltransferase [Thermodesulfobacteriota bacterium]|nr:polyribonucleotide nucleotidyltransferase [Desulfovibrionales bacterium]MDQ7837798.1 polyribonucleotide nucleotidyltransferase [Thermodesulfobacteriota bacterium]